MEDYELKVYLRILKFDLKKWLLIFREKMYSKGEVYKENNNYLFIIQILLTLESLL